MRLMLKRLSIHTSTDYKVTFQRVDTSNYKLVSNISGELLGNVKRMLSYKDYVCIRLCEWKTIWLWVA